MTTDTVPKGVTRSAEIAGETVTINGIGKGTQMIHPDMATTLNFLFTDAKILAPVLQKCLAYAADQIVVVVTDEPTSLTDGYAFIKIAHNERPETPVKVVTNMVNSTTEGERTYNTLNKACQGFLKYSPEHLGIVRRDDKVRAAIRAQESILSRAPDSAAAEDVKQIARILRRGRAQASFSYPAGVSPGLAGTTVHHAYLLLDFTGFQTSFVSNAVDVALL